ncbi:hypothetical protein [Singulisphaera acidiphila]|uniref:Uncharacterized protein n=1 Tax=Singulisphaera acidiphila (strain ATCC BAA-1392 / DSM 18658 / VKM B-2454 / MOB10) TaxID=886293 RepID=L0D722_SINAD|nr:hypothetical protein [Singulisphaera acidiphila]AGA25037.1 hypothetical protein Sinac_0620 [Singulisphaera acidiphila DSM 18658]
MTYYRLPVNLSVTPEYVLAVLRDSHRQQCQFDPEADAHIELTFETTIDEWRAACDLLECQYLGRGLDTQWKLDRSSEVWCTVLEPAKERTLRELCEFIALTARRPVIEPVIVLGRKCLAASAFFVIRSMLRNAGADVDSVTPSTPLDQYTRRHLGVFLGSISKLAPGALPNVKLDTSLDDMSNVGLMLGLCIAFAGCFISALTATTGVILALVSWATPWLAAHYLPPPKAQFGSLRTFRDLAILVADGSRQWEGRGT